MVGKGQAINLAEDEELGGNVEELVVDEKAKRKREKTEKKEQKRKARAEASITIDEIPVKLNEDLPRPRKRRGGAGGGGRGRGGPRGGAPGRGGSTVAGSTISIASHVEAVGIKRPGFGLQGRPLEVHTNHFECSTPEGIIHHYDGLFFVLCYAIHSHRPYILLLCVL